MQHMVNNVVKTEVDNLLNSVNNASGPILPNQNDGEAIKALNDQISSNIVNSQDANVELKVGIYQENNFFDAFTVCSILLSDNFF